MRTVLALVAKDFRVFWSDKLAVGLTFAVPMVLIAIFGLIFGGGSGTASGVRVLVVDEARSEGSARMIEALAAEGGLDVRRWRTLAEGERRLLTRVDAQELLREDASSFRFALIFPEDFERDVFGFRLHYWYNPQSEVEHQVVSGLLQKVFFTHAIPLLQDRFVAQTEEWIGADGVRQFQESIAALISEVFSVPADDVLAEFPDGSVLPRMDFGRAEAGGDEGADVATEGAAVVDPFDFLLDLEQEQFFGQGINPAAQSVAGWAVMFLLFSLSGAAASLFDERKADLFQRLLAGPVTRDHILWSKYLYLGLLGLLQLVVLLAFGEVAFGIFNHWGQLGPLFVVSVAAAAAATAFGMILCALARSPSQANGLGTLLILSMSALGGAMFPSFMLPAFVRDYLAPLTPVHWAMDGMLAVLWRDAGYAGIWAAVGVLLGMAAACLVVAQWGFRRGDLFR